MKAVFLALLLCSSAVILFTPKVAAQDKPRRVEVVAKRWEFTPGEVSVKKGESVTLVLTSQDVDHGIKFKDLNVNVVAKKGKSNEVTFTPSKTGDFIGQCSVFCGSGHGAMHFTLHVTE